MISSASSVIDKTVTGLGYELVDIERAPRGLLRIYIDRPARLPEESPEAYSQRLLSLGIQQGLLEYVTVEDCERVTRQLQHVLEVESVAYERLEVSSPGLDRPLKKESDYLRFEGQEVEIGLKMPFEGRKKWRGQLHRRTEDGSQAPMGWRLVFLDGKQEKALDFELDEVKEARLVPVVDFKGRRFAAPEDAAAGHQDKNGGNQS